MEKKKSKKNNPSDNLAEKSKFVAKPENVKTIVPSNKPKLRLVENTSSKFKLIITSDCELKIRQLCSMINSIEYSGFVFYDIVSMKDDFSEGVIKAFDFLPMDVGSSGFTKFEYTPDVIRYMMLKKIAGKCQYGLLHSHHSMRSNPSLTDIETINKEGEDRNHFLSIIVNNEGSYHAFFTRRIKTTTVGTITEEYSSFNNEQKKVEIKVNDVDEYVEYVEMKIVMAYPNAKELSDRIAEIKKKNASTIKIGNAHNNPASLRTYTGTAERPNSRSSYYEGKLFPNGDMNDYNDYNGVSHRFGEEPKAMSESMWEISNREIENATKGKKVNLNKIVLSSDREELCASIAKELFTKDPKVSIDDCIDEIDEMYLEGEYNLVNIVSNTFNSNNDPMGSLACGVMHVLLPYVGSYSIAVDLIDTISSYFEIDIMY